ncbi:MAG TPA: methyl-accepting chemotaxis protein [Ferrovibrio sp.]|uniref:methyl-accepting chemotaxis protein n=1 Tax=Ferrovibrio sp. TaxID=1917215 RepID=UPI002ED22634
MRVLSRLNIGPRIYVVIVLMAALTIGIGWMGIFAMDRYQGQTNQMSALTERALISERVARQVAQIEAQSRGIYAAQNPQEISEYAGAIADTIASIEKQMEHWQSVLPPDVRASFDEQVKAPMQSYFNTRRMVAATALNEGVAAAMIVGEDDTVVNMRKKMVAALSGASERNGKLVADMNGQLAAFHGEQRMMMIAITAAGLLIAIVIALLIVIGTISRPITRITATMRKLADGDLETVVYGAERRDEIGAMAQTVQIFKDNMVARSKAEAEIAEQRREAEERRALREARERKAIEEISELCDRIAAGDLGMRLDETGKEGFLLTMCQRLNGLAGMLQAMTGELATITGALADGDVTRHVEGDYAGVFGELKDGVNRMAGRLKDFAQRLRASAAAVRDASGEISAGSQDLASRTESQAASIEETAASMHEITATVKQNADNAAAANQLATAARDTAEKGGSVVKDAVAAVSQIETSAQKISDIVSLIDEIAFQTNLLALNASVEAARAGEAGKGFAVVAQEVRALAQRSANASKDIKTLINESNAQVKTGAQLVNQTGASLTEIVTAVKKVADIVAEIAAASREQASGLEQVNTAVASMDETTQRNGALVEQTSAAAQALSGQAGELAELVAFFRTGETPVAAAPKAALQPAGAQAPAQAAPAAADRTAKPAEKTAARKAVANPKPPPAAAPADDQDDWQEF